MHARDSEIRVRHRERRVPSDRELKLACGFHRVPRAQVNHPARVVELRLLVVRQRLDDVLSRLVELSVDGMHHGFRVQRLHLLGVALEHTPDDELRVLDVAALDRLGDAQDVRALRSLIHPAPVCLLVLGDERVEETVASGVLEQELLAVPVAVPEFRHRREGDEERRERDKQMRESEFVREHLGRVRDEHPRRRIGNAPTAVDGAADGVRQPPVCAHARGLADPRGGPGEVPRGARLARRRSLERGEEEVVARRARALPTIGLDCPRRALRAVPAAQISQDDIPRDLAALPTAHGVHAFASVSAEKVPVAHVSHVETPPTETTAVPGGHSVSIAVESTVNPAERLDTGSPIAAFSSLVTRAVSVTFHAPPSATGYKSGVST